MAILKKKAAVKDETPKDEVTVKPRAKVCGPCGGTGLADRDNLCDVCNGSGKA